MTLFLEISSLLAITTLVTMGVRLLKQPLVVGYMLSGIVAGPYFLNVLHSQDELELFSKVGIVFLLFIVGLHLNPKVVREVGTVSLITGLGQVIFTSLIGFGLALALGLALVPAIYTAIALTFSSTIIILKLLADKHDLQKLYAKISIGFLLVQDIVATLILIGVTVVATSSDQSLLTVFGWIVVKGLAVGVGLLAVSKFVLPRIVPFLATSQELLFLASLAWGTGLAALSQVLGFSIEIGALVAGVTLSMSPFADEMSSRLKPVRDFFIIIFFLLLGSQLVLSNLGAIVIPAIVLSIFVLVGNPIIVMVLMNLLGHKQKTGFLAGLTVAQISEFSLILASLALSVGHIDQQTLSLITLVGLSTIAGSTYLILYADFLFPRLQPWIKWLEFRKPKKGGNTKIGSDYDTVLFGYDRVGHQFVTALQENDSSVLVVDFNPEAISKLEESTISAQYGDAGDVEFLNKLPVSKPRLIVSTIPDVAVNKLILSSMQARNSRVVMIAIAHDVSQAHELYEAGLAYVVIPHHLGAEHAAKLIRKHGFHAPSYWREKQRHVQKLQRKYVRGSTG